MHRAAPGQPPSGGCAGGTLQSLTHTSPPAPASFTLLYPSCSLFLLLCSTFKVLLSGLQTVSPIPTLSPRCFREEAIAPCSVVLKHSAFGYLTTLFGGNNHLDWSLARFRNTVFKATRLNLSIFVCPVSRTLVLFYPSDTCMWFKMSRNTKSFLLHTSQTPVLAIRLCFMGIEAYLETLQNVLGLYKSVQQA